jgi:hypothetical protein
MICPLFGRVIRPQAGQPSPKRVPLAQAEQVLGLYRDRYFDVNVRHFYEKLSEEHGPDWSSGAANAGCIASGANGGLCLVFCCMPATDGHLVFASCWVSSPPACRLSSHCFCNQLKILCELSRRRSLSNWPGKEGWNGYLADGRKQLPPDQRCEHRSSSLPRPRLATRLVLHAKSQAAGAF